MRGDEARIADAFATWLQQHGWHIEDDAGFIDPAATQGGQGASPRGSKGAEGS